MGLGFQIRVRELGLRKVFGFRLETANRLGFGFGLLDFRNRVWVIEIEFNNYNTIRYINTKNNTNNTYIIQIHST